MHFKNLSVDRFFLWKTVCNKNNTIHYVWDVLFCRISLWHRTAVEMDICSKHMYMHMHTRMDIRTSCVKLLHFVWKYCFSLQKITVKKCSGIKLNLLVVIKPRLRRLLLLHLPSFAFSARSTTVIMMWCNLSALGLQFHTKANKRRLLNSCRLKWWLSQTSWVVAS